jgi:CheY-like chemotaxis protein
MKKIVVVDDDPDDIDLFKEAISETGSSYKCYVANNGKDLLLQFASGSIDDPDIIFLDVNMPEMNGWECLMKLKGDRKLRDIPVLMYSTSSALRDAEKALQLGALGFYEKPHTYTHLRDFLRQLSNSTTIDKKSLSDIVKSQGKAVKLFL